MKTRTIIALGACLSLVSIGASAHEIIAVDGDVEASGPGYIAAGDMVIKTGLGECLQTGDLNDDNLINSCAGIEDEIEVAVAEPEVVAEEPVAQQTSKIDTRQFSEQTLFDTDSAELNGSGQAVVNSMFAALAEYKGITGITVSGHTDARGSEAYNLGLSERRAQTVADQISAEYPDARIDVIGMGETSPIANNVTAEGRQLNRRVEIEVTATRMVFN